MTGVVSRNKILLSVSIGIGTADMNQSVMLSMLRSITGKANKRLAANSFLSCRYDFSCREYTPRGSAGSDRNSVLSSGTTSVYPACSTAAASAGNPVFKESKESDTASVARLTFAISTPSTFFKAFSTLATQLAQVIPSTGSVSNSFCVPFDFIERRPVYIRLLQFFLR